MSIAEVVAPHAGRLFLRVSDVAEVMGADPRTVRHAIEAGTIPAVRIGNTIRIPAERYWREVAQLGPETLRLLGFAPGSTPGGDDREPDRQASQSGSIDHPATGSHQHDDSPPDQASSLRHLAGL